MTEMWDTSGADLFLRIACSLQGIPGENKSVPFFISLGVEVPCAG